MKRNFSLLFILFSTSLFAVGGNLETVQSTYLQNLPRFIAGKITDLYDRLSTFQKQTQLTYVQQTRETLRSATPRVLNLQEQLVLLATQVTQTTTAASLRNTTKQLERVQREQVELTQVQFPVLASQINHSNLCEKHLPSVFLHDFPSYHIDEEIRPCDQPKPEGHSTPAGEEFRTSAYLPATTIGCGAFQFFIPIPIVGCLIGVAVGVGVGAAVGEGGRAIINAEENKKEWAAYHAGCESDKKNQLTDISRAKDFASENPITLEGVQRKTLKACLEHAPIMFVDELANERALFLKQRDELSREISRLELSIADLKQTLLEVESQKNSNQVTKRRQQVLIELETLEAKNELLSSKRQVIECLLEAGDSVREAEDCQRME